jgi:hypothetical protein
LKFYYYRESQSHRRYQDEFCIIAEGELKRDIYHLSLKEESTMGWSNRNPSIKVWEKIISLFEAIAKETNASVIFLSRYKGTENLNKRLGFEPIEKNEEIANFITGVNHWYKIINMESLSEMIQFHTTIIHQLSKFKEKHPTFYYHFSHDFLLSSISYHIADYRGIASLAENGDFSLDSSTSIKKSEILKNEDVIGEELEKILKSKRMESLFNNEPGFHFKKAFGMLSTGEKNALFESLTPFFKKDTLENIFANTPDDNNRILCQNTDYCTLLDVPLLSKFIIVDHKNEKKPVTHLFDDFDKAYKKTIDLNLEYHKEKLLKENSKFYKTVKNRITK